jgi:hypothetical protein
MTVTVIVPVNTLLAAASPLPAGDVAAACLQLGQCLAGQIEVRPGEALMLPVLETLVFDLVAADVFSVIVTVIVSPT